MYWWVDGTHFNIRLEEDRQCILVVMGVTESGKKELIAVADSNPLNGCESEQLWTEVLLDLKSRSLDADPKLVVGDGALGFWKALLLGARIWDIRSLTVAARLTKTVTI